MGLGMGLGMALVMEEHHRYPFDQGHDASQRDSGDEHRESSGIRRLTPLIG